MQGLTPVPRNYFEILEVDLHCGPNVYSIGNDVDVAIGSMFPTFPWSQTCMRISVERNLGNVWGICKASNRAVFTDFTGSLQSNFLPFNPPVILQISDTNDMLILYSQVLGPQKYYVRFKINVPSIQFGGPNEKFRLNFTLVVDLCTANGQVQSIPLQTKYSNVFDVYVPRLDANTYRLINENIPINPTPAHLSQLAVDPNYDNFCNIEQYEGNLEHYLSNYNNLTNEHDPIKGYNPLKNLNDTDDIVQKISQLMIDQEESMQLSNLLVDKFKFIVRKKDHNKTVQQLNDPEKDTSKHILVPLVQSGEAIEVILINDLDDTCGFTASVVVHVPGLGILEFNSSLSSSGKIDTDGIFTIIPKGGFLYSSLIATNKENEKQDVTKLTLMIKVVMDQDQITKYFLSNRRCIIVLGNNQVEN